MTRSGPFFFLVALVVLALDQLTKLWIIHTMIPGESRRVFGNVFRLTYVQNEGAAFGLSFGGRWSFVVMTILVAVFILVYYARSERTRIARWALALILGGAIGNLVDRIRVGEVVDFFHVSVRGVSWPIFNIADIGITVGVALLALHLFRKDRHESADVAGGEADESDDAVDGRHPVGP